MGGGGKGGGGGGGGGMHGIYIYVKKWQRLHLSASTLPTSAHVSGSLA